MDCVRVSVYRGHGVCVYVCACVLLTLYTPSPVMLLSERSRDLVGIEKERGNGIEREREMFVP